jgi:hypothetical protein
VWQAQTRECVLYVLQQLWHAAIVAGNKETTFGNALWGQASEFAFQGRKTQVLRQGVLEGTYDCPYLRSAFVHELQPKVANASIEPQGQVWRAHLGFCPEDGVAASHIGHDRVHAPGFVLQRYPVLFTGMATVGVVGAGGQKAAEDAVLGVKDRQVLIGYDL